RISRSEATRRRHHDAARHDGEADVEAEQAMGSMWADGRLDGDRAGDLNLHRASAARSQSRGALARYTPGWCRYPCFAMPPRAPCRPLPADGRFLQAIGPTPLVPV